MSKPFKTYDEQIDILEQRNIVISDRRHAHSLLRRENYYSIINGYKDIFLDRAQTVERGYDFYQEGTTLEQVYALYDFDRNLRAAFLKCLLKSETCLKTKVSYYFSQKHPEPFAYFNLNNFKNENIPHVTRLISTLSTQIQRNAQGETINHYLCKHKELPLWVLAQKLTYGEISNFFLAMNSPEKELVVVELISEFNQNYPLREIRCSPSFVSNIGNVLRFLTEYRNICAHGERIYDHTYKRTKRSPKIEHLNFLDITFRYKLMDVILVLPLFISPPDYKKLISEIDHEFSLLESALPPLRYTEVMSRMQFKLDWKTAAESFYSPATLRSSSE